MGHKSRKCNVLVPCESTLTKLAKYAEKKTYYSEKADVRKHCPLWKRSETSHKIYVNVSKENVPVHCIGCSPDYSMCYGANLKNIFPPGFYNQPCALMLRGSLERRFTKGLYKNSRLGALPCCLSATPTLS